MADVLVVLGPAAVRKAQAGKVGKIAEFLVPERTLGFVLAHRVATAVIPEGLHRLVIVRGVGGEGAVVVFASHDHPPLIVFLPLADFEAGNIEAEQMRAHIVRHGAEILSHDLGAARRSEDDAQVFVTMGEIGGLVFR